jgi:succinyl-diaminopimelate desuccinylase
VAGNVVPDRAVVRINHRFAPDRTAADAVEGIRALLGDAVDDEGGDTIVLLDSSPPAPPGLDHPLLAQLVASTGQPPLAKLGWTDVAFFAAHGIPATNFGPGEPTVAHTKDEHVSREQIDEVYNALRRLVV